MGIPFDARQQPRTTFAEPSRPTFYASPPPSGGSNQGLRASQRYDTTGGNRIQPRQYATAPIQDTLSRTSLEDLQRSNFGQYKATRESEIAKRIGNTSPQNIAADYADLDADIARQANRERWAKGLTRPRNPRTLDPFRIHIPTTTPERPPLEIPKWFPKAAKWISKADLPAELAKELLFPDPLNNQEDKITNDLSNPFPGSIPTFKPDGSQEFNLPGLDKVPDINVDGYYYVEVSLYCNSLDNFIEHQELVNGTLRGQTTGQAQSSVYVDSPTSYTALVRPPITVVLGEVVVCRDEAGNVTGAGASFFGFRASNQGIGTSAGGIGGLNKLPDPPGGVAKVRTGHNGFKIEVRPHKVGAKKVTYGIPDPIVLPKNDKFKPKEPDDMPCDTCKFDPKIIKRVVEDTLTQSVKLDVYNEDKDAIEAKDYKVFGVKAATDSIKLLYSEFAKLRKKKFSIGIPEWWAVRIGADRPQMVIQFADKENGKIGRSRWSVSIPHYNKGKAAINLPDYQKGSYFATLTLKDNSKLTINAKDKTECDKMIDAIKPMIDPTKIPDPYQVQYGERKGQSLSTKIVTATIAQFYSKGQKDTAADFEIECNKTSPTPSGGAGGNSGSDPGSTTGSGSGNTAGGVDSSGTTSSGNSAPPVDSSGTTSSGNSGGGVTGGTVPNNP